MERIIKAVVYSQAPVLQSSRLQLRAYKLEDFHSFAELYTSQRSKFADGPVSIETAWNWFAAGAGRWSIVGYGAWAIDRIEDNECVGVVSLNHPISPRSERELGWLLWGPFEGHGYASEAAMLAKRFAFENLGWNTLVSYIDKNNVRSITLAKRLDAVLDEEVTAKLNDDTLVFRYSE